PQALGFESLKRLSAQQTWLSVLATFVAHVISFILTFKMREILSPKASSKRGQHRLSSRDVRISVFAVLKILLNQPQECDERFPMMRLVLGMTMLWGFLLSTFYKTFLTSMLVLPRVVEPYNTLEELVTKRPMLFTLVPGSFISAIAKEAEPNSTFGKLYRYASPWEKDYPRANENLLSGEYAFVGIKSSMYGIMNNVFAKGEAPEGERDPEYAREEGYEERNEVLVRTNEVESLRPLELKDFYGLGLATISFIVELSFRSWK
ncbi:Ionotropic receptor 156, partial [Hyalella azteca]